MGAEEPLGRPDLFVVARLLERLWRNQGPMRRTRLQVAARVNYDIFSRYLRWMVDRGLVALESEDELVALTRKGYEAYEHLVEWLDRFVGQQRGSPPSGR